MVFCCNPLLPARLMLASSDVVVVTHVLGVQQAYHDECDDDRQDTTCDSYPSPTASVPGDHEDYHKRQDSVVRWWQQPKSIVVVVSGWEL